MITDKEAYGLAFTDRLGRRIYKISSLLHEEKNTRVLGPFKAADRFGSGLRELERARAVIAPPYMRTYVHLQRPWGHTNRKKTPYFGEIEFFFPWPLEAIHAAAKLKLRAIWPK